jgi:hypothetical protein
MQHEQMNSQARHEQKGKSNDERMAEMLRENDAKWEKRMQLLMDSKRDQDERQQYQGRDYQDQRYDRRDLAPQDNMRGYQERNFGAVQDQQNDERYDMRNAYDGRYDMQLQDRQLYQQQERGRGNFPSARKFSCFS